MRLLREGIEDFHRRDDLVGLHRPTSAFDLLRHWHDSLEEIEPGYTFGDLAEMLRGLEDVEVLDPFFQCDVRALLDDPTPPRQGGDPPLDHVYVRNTVDPEGYVPDPLHPDEPLESMDENVAVEHDRVDAAIAELTGEPVERKVIDATSDDPITGEPRLLRLRGRGYGMFTAPYVITREFCGRGLSSADDGTLEPQTAFALDFTPVAELLSLPLRYDPTIRFESRSLQGTLTVEYETKIGITFGEFLHAIFWDLGFYGSPDDRNEAWREVRERSDSIRRLRGGES